MTLTLAHDIGFWSSLPFAILRLILIGRWSISVLCHILAALKEVD